MTTPKKACAGGCEAEGVIRLAISQRRDSGYNLACPDCVGAVLVQMLLTWPRISVTAVKS